MLIMLIEIASDSFEVSPKICVSLEIYFVFYIEDVRFYRGEVSFFSVSENRLYLEIINIVFYGRTESR